MRHLKPATWVGIAAAAFVYLLPAPAAASGKAAGLSAVEHQLLGNSRYVYIQSTRKDGSLSKPAEIWFLFANDAVWVATTPESWRAKRLKAGRPRARIAIGKLDGTAFFARGEFVRNREIEADLMSAFAIKYPEKWPEHEARFRSGFLDGTRVLIRYVPEE